MHNKFLISDTHFGHANILSFRDSEGNLTRGSVFNTVEEHDEIMVENWNRTVRPVDKVYHLGDVVMNRRCLKILERLNGKKVLIKGNHDIFKLKDYTPYFYDIRGTYSLPKHKLIISHIPIHPFDLDESERFDYNIHGHLHHNILPDKRYLNICVENIGYTPILLEEALDMLKEQNA